MLATHNMKNFPISMRIPPLFLSSSFIYLFFFFCTALSSEGCLSLTTDDQSAIEDTYNSTTQSRILETHTRMWIWFRLSLQKTQVFFW